MKNTKTNLISSHTSPANLPRYKKSEQNLSYMMFNVNTWQDTQRSLKSACLRIHMALFLNLICQTEVSLTLRHCSRTRLDSYCLRQDSIKLFIKVTLDAEYQNASLVANLNQPCQV